MPPAFQLEENEAWFRLTEKLSFFFQMRVSGSVEGSCPNEASEAVSKMQTKAGVDRCFFIDAAIMHRKLKKQYQQPLLKGVS